MAVAGEDRHPTITHTDLTTPPPGRGGLARGVTPGAGTTTPPPHNPHPAPPHAPPGPRGPRRRVPRGRGHHDHPARRHHRRGVTVRAGTTLLLVNVVPDARPVAASVDELLATATWRGPMDKHV